YLVSSASLFTSSTTTIINIQPSLALGSAIRSCTATCRIPQPLTPDGLDDAAVKLPSRRVTGPCGQRLGGVGFNWQLSPLWVVGLEGDFQGSDEKASTSFSNNVNFTVLAPTGGVPNSVPFSATAATSYATKIEWFGTARVRAGYLFGDGTVFT